MKIVLFSGPFLGNDEQLKEKLKALNYSCINSTQPDEIEQLGLQTQKLVIIFGDSKFAYRFLKDNTWSKFEMMRVLYLIKKPKIPPDAEAKIRSVNLKVYYNALQDKLITDIGDFWTKKAQEDDFSFLEFNVDFDKPE